MDKKQIILPVVIGILVFAISLVAMKSIHIYEKQSQEKAETLQTTEQAIEAYLLTNKEVSLKYTGKYKALFYDFPVETKEQQKQKLVITKPIEEELFDRWQENYGVDVFIEGIKYPNRYLNWISAYKFMEYYRVSGTFLQLDKLLEARLKEDLCPEVEEAFRYVDTSFHIAHERFLFNQYREASLEGGYKILKIEDEKVTEHFKYDKQNEKYLKEVGVQEVILSPDHQYAYVQLKTKEGNLGYVIGAEGSEMTLGYSTYCKTSQGKVYDELVARAYNGLLGEDIPLNFALKHGMDLKEARWAQNGILVVTLEGEFEDMGQIQMNLNYDPYGDQLNICVEEVERAEKLIGYYKEKVDLVLSHEEEALYNSLRKDFNKDKAAKLSAQQVVKFKVLAQIEGEEAVYTKFSKTIPIENMDLQTLLEEDIEETEALYDEQGKLKMGYVLEYLQRLYPIWTNQGQFIQLEGGKEGYFNWKLQNPTTGTIKDQVYKMSRSPEGYWQTDF